MAFDVLKHSKIADGAIPPQYSSVQDKCVIGLDRDGIINHIPDVGYVKTKDELIIIDGVLDAIKIMRSKGYKTTIVSDQPHIAKGSLAQWEVDVVNQRLMEIFGQARITNIEGLYYNTSDVKEDIYAKPNPGMFKRAETEVPGVDFSKGYYVGDSLVDLKAAVKVKAKPILIRTGNGKEVEKLLDKFSNQELKKKARIYSSLLEFANDLP